MGLGCLALFKDRTKPQEYNGKRDVNVDSAVTAARFYLGRGHMSI